MAEEQRGVARFRVQIDGKTFDWPRMSISGSDIKGLAGVSGHYGIWMERSSGEDSPIDESERIVLSADIVQKFFTGMMATTEG
jgi:hypothetical protein